MAGRRKSAHGRKNAKTGRFEKAASVRDTALSFLDLPAEIRQMVYESCLITRRVIRPIVVQYELDDGVRPYSAWPAEDKVAIGLLGTCHLIREEARRVLYGKNTWHISGRYDKHWSPPFCGMGMETSSLWRLNVDLFRSVEVSLDFRDVDNRCRRQVMGAVFRRPRIPSQSPDYSEDRTKLVHNLLMSTIFFTWIAKLALVRQMCLSQFTVHLSDCTCPGSCCRLEKFVVSDAHLLGPWHRKGQPLEDNPDRPPSLRRNTFLPRDAARAWGKVPDKPANLGKIRFQVKGDSLLMPDSVEQYVHEAGLGCHSCPIVEGQPQPESCLRANNVPSPG